MDNRTPTEENQGGAGAGAGNPDVAENEEVEFGQNRNDGDRRDHDRYARDGCEERNDVDRHDHDARDGCEEPPAWAALGVAGCRINDTAPKFDGSTDVFQRIKRARQAGEIFSLNIAVLLPVILEGDAFALFDRVPKKDQRDFDLVTIALNEAYAFDRHSAYDQFKPR